MRYLHLANGTFTGNPCSGCDAGACPAIRWSHSRDYTSVLPEGSCLKMLSVGLSSPWPQVTTTSGAELWSRCRFHHFKDAWTICEGWIHGSIRIPRYLVSVGDTSDTSDTSSTSSTSSTGDTELWALARS